MTRTEQAHDWSLYAVLGIFTCAVCYAFLFTDKLPGEAFTAIAGTVFTYFFTKAKSGESNGGDKTPTPTTPPTGAPTP